MKRMLVACETIEDEVKDALKRLGLDYPVIWLEGGLHSSPDRLRKRLQELLDQAEGQCDDLIFTLGYCGGGVSDLQTGGYTSILPLADDCISILLGSLAARKKASSPATYFLTEGWMRHESNVVTSYDHTVKKYGQERADRINRMMLKHYRRFGLVDTGSYDLGEAAVRVGPLAQKVEVTVETLPGEMNWLEALLTGPYDDPSRFLVLPPHTPLNFDQWRRLLTQVTPSLPGL
ncbi:MAG: DUF1638 domain-containing protein [Candidatus Adiutrix sp.]|nr:DUF1638 domain-containing protein [Candidatus Adiutrix sp.]